MNEKEISDNCLMSSISKKVRIVLQNANITVSSVVALKSKFDDI